MIPHSSLYLVHHSFALETVNITRTSWQDIAESCFQQGFWGYLNHGKTNPKLSSLASSKMKSFSLILAASALLAGATPMVQRDADYSCPGQTVVSEALVGANKDVQLTQYTCPGTSKREESSLSARQTAQTTIDVCGNQCTTICFTPAGGGPDPNDCHVIADAMRFESQQTGDNFNITNGATNFVLMSYLSCKTVFVNQNTQANETYCLSDWATVTDFIAPNCQSTQNAHGGQCNANDGVTWFIEVSHS
ncbi:hypothetical protein D9757_004744 [Collybiopsis confluens]|uniref:Uncharacterized protein n=1 Tax=Collybiopsis confluens TaxID=2823264 RepID=A0A8H5HSI7_9AGAR|nr:hypothetical protein D9757_004744 [Collybiopsis confluens]